MQVLAIDDDPDDLDFLSDVISHTGSSVKYVAKSSAEEALTYLDGTTEVPGVILLDANMPKMSGIECLEILRQNPKLDNTRIIIFSTAITKDMMQSVKKLNASFIRKPSSMKEWIDIVKSLF